MIYNLRCFIVNIKLLNIEGMFQKRYNLIDFPIFVCLFILGIYYFLCSYNLELRELITGQLFFLSVIFNIMLFFFISLKQMINKTSVELLSVAFLGIILFMNVVFTGGAIGSLVIMLNVIVMLINSKYVFVQYGFYRMYSFLLLGVYPYYFLSLDNLEFNPNIVGVVILLITIYACLFFGSKAIFKPIVILLIGGALIMILNTESRGALLGLIFFVIFNYLIPARIAVNKLFHLIIYSSLTIGSLVFTFVYFSMWKRNVVFNLPFTNKSLYTGRESIWLEVWTAFFDQPILGIGSNYQLQTFESLNIHNSMLSILAIYGLPTFLLFIVIAWSRLKSLIPLMISEPEVKVVVFGFYSMLVVGVFENYLVNIIQFFAIFFLFFIGYSVKMRNEGVAR